MSRPTPRCLLLLALLFLGHVLASALTVTAPNGGEHIQRYAGFTITWTSTAGGNVKIELLRSNGEIDTLEASTPNDGTHAWSFDSTQQPDGAARIRITSTTNLAETDTSDAAFVVSGFSSSRSVWLNASVSSSPPAITLHWQPWQWSSVTGYNIYRRVPATIDWGVKIGTAGPAATSYTDTTAAVGVLYEYKVERNPTGPATSPGVIEAGIQVPLVESRGTVVLLVDDTFSASLAPEIARLSRDLVGDGWQVVRHDVARTASTASVRAILQAAYSAAPSQVNTAYILGRITRPLLRPLCPRRPHRALRRLGRRRLLRRPRRHLDRHGRQQHQRHRHP